MRHKKKYSLSVFTGLALLFLLAGMAFQPEAAAFTLEVVGCGPTNTCNVAVGDFRWLLEEDNTVQSPPGVRVSDSIGLSIHQSHAPVVCTGNGTDSVAIDTESCPSYNSNNKYYLTVLPGTGFSVSGSMVAANQATPVSVKVHQNPIPAAQISVLIFNDNDPINNVYDATESGLGGWTLLLQDAGGPMLTDVFGNPLGTLYVDNDVNSPIMGSGMITTCTQAEVDAFAAASDVTAVKACTRVGEVLIKNVAPGKYGIRAIAPTAEATQWVQTATIEGTPGVDAWVKANEPQKFIEGFGTGFYHVFIGFVRPSTLPWAVSPPAGGTVSGRNVFTHFTKPGDPVGFPDGPPVGECWVGINDLAATPPDTKGKIAVPCDMNSNFSIPNVPARSYQLVTWDKPLDALFGFHNVDVPGGGINLGTVQSFRWFGTLQGTVFFDTDQDGFMDAGEVGMMEQNINIRFRDGSVYMAQPTDISGEYAFTEVFPFFKWLVVESDFARFKPTGMTAVVDAGGPPPPATSVPVHNGWVMPSFDALNPQPQKCTADDVTNSVDNCVAAGVGGNRINPNTGNNLSRTEMGPVLTQAMQLYLNQTNVIDWGRTNYNTGLGENGGISGVVGYGVTRAENDPRFAGIEPWEPGIPRVQIILYRDVTRDGVIDELNGTPGIQLADVDNYPLGWFDGGARGPEDVDRNDNGIFDMGDAYQITWTDSFDDNQPADCIQNLPPLPGVQPCYDNYSTWNQLRPGLFDGGYAFGFAAGGPHLPVGGYIVQAAPPQGYEIQKEEDKNIDFGDEFGVSPLLLPPVCVGTFANTGVNHTVPAYLTLFPDQMVDAPSSGLVTPTCDFKMASATPGKNTAADFSMFTFVPKAARVVGFANNDLSAEFNAFSPIFGEKASPGWLPVSFQDWQGNEVARAYTDEWGSYNALLPSTFSVNVPSPSGVSPNMITMVLNHPFLPNGSIDTHYNPNFAVSPWTLDYWPGKSTYADTPMVPVAAFAGMPFNGPDVEPASGTPVITKVSNTTGGADNGPVVCANGETITITSAGTAASVLNPDYDPGVPGSQQYITRNYGFGTTAGTVTIGGSLRPVTSWSENAISVSVGTSVPTGRVVVTKADGRKSFLGATVHVTPGCANVVWVDPGTNALQNAIDAADDGDIILAKPGNHIENVIMDKPVILQGYGAGATNIFANPSPAERLKAWHEKVLAILGNDPFDANEAPGIMVIGSVSDFTEANSMINGFRIFGAISGGGVYVDNDVSSLKISDNLITGNQGVLGGGITLGTPGVEANNPNIVVEYNQIVKNGGVQGGGGFTAYTGSTNYSVRYNMIAGNFSRSNGGGISHVGQSDGGMIQNNTIAFNEVAFGGAVITHGAGIFLGVDATLAGINEGAGNVTISRNLIQGNLAGVGNGGGIQAFGFNVAGGPDHTLNIVNNMIVNNVAGLAGGGIALQDAWNVNIYNNTVANNDSTATSANAFPANGTVSNPQGAGIVATSNSIPDRLFNNIIYNNRSFTSTLQGVLTFNAVRDLQVQGAGTMNPRFCLLTSTAGYHSSNVSGNPQFVLSYLNNILTALVIDEGGNQITVRHRQVQTSLGDYHINSTSPAVNNGTASFSGLSAPTVDYDGQSRPIASGYDRGADEVGRLTVTVPNGGESWAAGTSQTIRWTYMAAVGLERVRIELLKDGVLNRTIVSSAAIGSGGNGSYNWTIPATQTPGSDYIIRVTSTTDATATDVSNANFTITGAPAPGITVTVPNGGEAWTRGTLQTIRWTYTGNPGASVRIELLKGGVLNLTIASSVTIGSGGNGSRNWTIPSNQTLGSDYTIRVTSTTNGAATDVSNANFTITGAPTPGINVRIGTTR